LVVSGSIQPRPRVLITGASRGIGRAAAFEFAGRGADLVLTYSKGAEEIDQIAKELLAFEVEVGVHSLSMNEPESVRDLANEVKNGGPLDALILNAGVWAGGRIEEIGEEEWWSVVQTNLRGTYLVTRALLPLLRKGSYSSITLVSSVVGIIGFKGDTAYAAAKAGLIGFGRSLAKELGSSQIRVNILAPGFIETNMTSAVSKQGRANISKEVILERMGTPEEIAKCLSFMTFDATYMTGSVIVVDGGWSI
jgi:3-oxoacyl-[acyl-carrier protein] reductase